MKASQILRKAAENLERSLNGELIKFGCYEAKELGGCCLIESAFGDFNYMEDKWRADAKYTELFYKNKPFWFGPPCTKGKVNVKNQNHRLMALLLTAQILEDEGD
jgi:hypothetical protein